MLRIRVSAIDLGIITVSSRVLYNGEERRVNIEEDELSVRELLVKRVQFRREL